MRCLLALFLCACVLASCRRNATNVALASLDRTDKIQLLCADLELDSANLYILNDLLPLEACDPDATTATDAQVQLLGAVTQTQNGTVAIASFTRSTIFDTNRTVPGVTAFRVGEEPTGLQISPFEPTYAYVSSFSAKSVQAIPTEALLVGDSVLATQQLRFDAGPSDLALHELAAASPPSPVDPGQDPPATSDRRYGIVFRNLYAAIPELGQVAQIRIEIEPLTGAQRLGEVTFLPLGTYDCDSVTLGDPPESTAENTYHRICPVDGPDARNVKTVRTTATCVDGDASGPRPIALTIDSGVSADEGSEAGTADDVLLVADANQPVIHRFALDRLGATPIDPIITGTPTNDVAVTPFVPATPARDDRAATERYLYAVSTTDSSVLAIDYAEPSDTFGQVLPVIAGISERANEENVESRNRVRSRYSNARAIEVISPFYGLEPDPTTGGFRVPEADICNASDSEEFSAAQNPSNLRGVFLAVSLSNGTLFFLDIYDLNAPCRGGACVAQELGVDRLASIRRHRRRFRSPPPVNISLDGTPSIQFNAAPGRIDPTTGDAAASDGPGLELIPCPPSMLNIFGATPSSALICASSQVWSSFTQRWEARWQGLIPDTEGGLGQFSDTSFDGTAGNWFLAGDVPFCRVGVLGQLAITDPASELAIERLGYVGDRLLITGELPPSRRDEPACQEFASLEEDIDNSPVWFPIRQAFNDELEIGPSPNPNRYTLDEVRFCFPELTQYQVHTRDAYTVVGTTSGFINKVVPDAEGRCVLDSERPLVVDDVDTYLTGRAFEDTQYINPLVSFRIGPFDPATVVNDSTLVLLNFNVLNQFVFQEIDTSGGRSSLPASMLFSRPQDQLFFVDFEIGLRRIIFSPLSIIQSFE